MLRMALLGGAGLATVLSLGVGLASRAIAMHHQLEGGLVLAKGIALASNETGGEDTWNPVLSLYSNRRTRALAEEAVNHLEIAKNLDPRLAHVYLLLGRANMVLGSQQSAIEAYRQYVRLRPENPLARWELAQAIESMCRSVDSESVVADRVLRSGKGTACGDEALEIALVAEWSAAGLAAEDFLEAKNQALLAEDYEEALLWYERALLTAQEKLDYFPSSMGDRPMLLESYDSTSAWQQCFWCENVQGHFGARGGVLEMSYINKPYERDRFAYISLPNLPVRDFSELLLRLKGVPGTLLTIEVVQDNLRTRPFNYQPSPNDWEIWNVPISGEVLNEILIGIGELDLVSMPEEHRLTIDWIALR